MTTATWMDALNRLLANAYWMQSGELPKKKELWVWMEANDDDLQTLKNWGKGWTEICTLLGLPETRNSYFSMWANNNAYYAKWVKNGRPMHSMTGQHRKVQKAAPFVAVTITEQDSEPEVVSSTGGDEIRASDCQCNPDLNYVCGFHQAAESLSAALDEVTEQPPNDDPAELRAEIDRLRTMLADVQQSRDETYKRTSRMYDDAQRFEEEAKEAQRRVAELEEQVAEFEEQNVDREHIDKLRERAEEAERYVREADRRIVELEVQIADLRSAKARNETDDIVSEFAVTPYRIETEGIYFTPNDLQLLVDDDKSNEKHFDNILRALYRASWLRLNKQ